MNISIENIDKNRNSWKKLLSRKPTLTEREAKNLKKTIMIFKKNKTFIY